jgi:hypothetical protein
LPCSRNLATVHGYRGDAARAVVRLGQALRLRVATLTSPFELAETRFALARALWAAGTDRARARTLARWARDGYAASPRATKVQLPATNRWIAAHPS